MGGILDTFWWMFRHVASIRCSGFCFKVIRNSADCREIWRDDLQILHCSTAEAEFVCRVCYVDHLSCLNSIAEFVDVRQSGEYCSFDCDAFFLKVFIPMSDDWCR